MKNIIPISDLQRQAANIINDVNESAEPVIITQRGRASAVIISAKRYAEIEEDLKALDDLELIQLVETAEHDVAQKKTVSHSTVKKRLKFSK